MTTSSITCVQRHRRRRLCTIIASLQLICVAAFALHAVADRPPAAIAGRLQLHQALTLYVVNQSGGDFTVNLRWRDEQQTQADRPRLLRVFDPDEHLLLRHEEPGKRVTGAVPEIAVQLAVNARGAGVYQICVTGFGGDLDFSTSPSLPWGVTGHPRLVGRGDQFANAFVYLPPKLESFPIRCEGEIEELRLSDESGKAQILTHGVNASGSAALPKDAEHVWQLCIKAPGEYMMDFSGMPIILCPDEHSARAIHASVDMLDDGTICFHKFQVRAHQVLRRYREAPPEMFSVRVPMLEQYRGQWLGRSARNDLLLGSYGVYAALPATLREQNLDRGSPWFGTIAVWRDAAGRPRTDNPWSTYTRSGLNRVAAQASVFGAVYSIDEPFNPLRRDAGLRNRAIIASLQELMLLREHELPLAAVPDNYFGGERAFTFSSFLHCFPLVVRDCPVDVREIWTDGLRRYVEHESISQVTLNVNQWTFIIKGLQHFLDGTDEEWCRSAIQRHLRWIAARNQWDRGQQPAGYFDEFGPDATYNGITLHHLAWVYKQNRDPALLEALRRCIDLFNHTIAPQPGGKLLGASSFCTRTPGDWTEPQYGGGLAMLADELAEASPQLDRVWPTERSMAGDVRNRRANDDALLQRLSYMDFNIYSRQRDAAATIATGPEIHFMIWQHFASVPRRGALPVLTQRDFTRNFGDEFFCVRRPTYYAFLYAGQPMPDWMKNQRPADPRAQYPRNGGGLCMFWSPAFGSSLLAKNWSAYAAQSIIIEHQGKTDWEDYWSVKNTFDEPAARATVSGTILNQPLEFRRQWQFEQDRVECNLSLHANVGCEFDAAWECFPYSLDPAARLRVTLLDETGQPVGNRPASAVVFRNGSPEAHVVVFASPRSCRILTERSTDRYQKPREHGSVQAALPRQLKPGQPASISWSIQRCNASDVAQTIQEAIARLNRPAAER